MAISKANPVTTTRWREAVDIDRESALETYDTFNSLFRLVRFPLSHTVSQLLSFGSPVAEASISKKLVLETI